MTTRDGALRDSPAKGQSRRLVLDLIRASGPISRIELASAAALTPATITNVVRELLHDGLVAEVGTGEPTGGKRRTLLQLRADAQFAVGALLGFGSVSYVVVNLWGEVVGSRDAAGAGDDEPEQLVARMAEEIRLLVDDLAIERSRVLGIGLVVPGPIDPSAGVAVQLPSGPPWRSYPVRAALEEATGLHVLMENDATAAAMGEYWSGATGSSSSFATIHMSLGIGAGIVVGGVPLRGVSSNAGEIGHLSLDRTGARCHCGNRGCLELYAAPAAGEERYRSMTGHAVPWSRIAELAAGGDVVASEVVQESAEALATAATSLVNILDIDLLVLTGPGFGAAAELFAETVQRRLAETFFARRSHQVAVRASGDMRSAAALGGATLVLHERLIG